MRQKFLAFAMAAALVASGLPRAAALADSAASVILMDAGSGRVLYERNADEKRLIASTTKLMTALVAAEELTDLSEPVTAKPEWLLTEGSSIYLAPGETVTVETLLYGLLLESGNDAATVLACHCAGSVEGFAALMNKKAEELGMTRSSFQNPSGLNADGHYSTAADMAILAAACLKNELVATICRTRSITLEGRTFVNHNRLLSSYEGCIGMKTGYTQRAGRTLVSAAERDGRTLIAVTLNAPNDWKDHTTLFDYGFSAYSEQVCCTAGEVLLDLPVEGSLVRFVPVTAVESFSYPVKEGEVLRSEVTCVPWVSAPVDAGETVGTITHYLGDAVMGETKLCAAQSVRRDALGEQTLLQKILSAILGQTVTVLRPSAKGK